MQVTKWSHAPPEPAERAAEGGRDNSLAPTEEELDQLFQALSDQTRRDIIRRCLDQKSSVSDLADAYPMSFAAVQKHVAVLTRAGLVTKERRGREQLVTTDIDAVRRARELLDHMERTWRGRVNRMDQLLSNLVDEEKEKGD